MVQNFTDNLILFCCSSSSFCLSGLSPSTPRADGQTPLTTRTVSYVPTVATPRPALTPSRGQTPTLCPSVPSEKSPLGGLCSSGKPGLHVTPNHKELSQSGVDSSGYSSSEGTLRKPKAATTSGTNKIHGNSGYRSRISSAFLSLMGEYRVFESKCVCLFVCLCMPV